MKSLLAAVPRSLSLDRPAIPRFRTRLAGFRWSALWLLLLPLPGLSYLFVYGLPMTHDGVTHLMRIARLDEAIRQGYLFPRWLPDLLLGYGYPALNYYAAGSYYLVELLHLGGTADLYTAFVLAQALLVLLAGMGMYRLAYDLFAEFSPQPAIPALVAAAAYVYAPYLLINLYVRGAIAELGAQMLLPWILWSFRRIMRSPDPQAFVWSAALSLGLLAWTHTISLLTAPPLLVAYLVMLAAGRADWRTRAKHSAVAILMAMGISCFYWAPLLAERGYITDYGLHIAKTFMLPISFFRWETVWSTTLRYHFPEDPPFRLGLVQALTVLAGLPFVLRRGREWRFWVGVLVFCALLMAQISAPLWFSNDILPVIQFPWRLLAIAAIPMSLLAGLPFAHLRHSVLRAGLAALLMALLIWAHLPHLPWAYLLSPTSRFDMAVNAYFEAGRTRIIEGAAANASVQEFRPRWTNDTQTLDLDSIVSPAPAHPPQFTLLAADAFTLRLQTQTEAALPLHLASYYFPGWTVTLGDGTPLPTYPSTNLGLLTVDIPPGMHTLTVAWRGTRAATIAALVSQVALLLLVIWQLRRRSPQRWMGTLLLPVLVWAAIGSYWRPLPQPVQQPESSEDLPGLRFLGHRGLEVTGAGIAVYPYWLTTQTAPPSFMIRWRLLDATGRTVAETESRPFHDAADTHQWVHTTLVDDAYLIPIPQGLPAGEYQVVMASFDGATGEEDFARALGTVALPASPLAPQPVYPLRVRFGDEIVLTGYDRDLLLNLQPGPETLPNHPEIGVVKPGQALVYTLYWQTRRETDQPYVGFIHLADRLGRPIVQKDHSPGPLFQPVAVWTRYNTYADRYVLPIPAGAPSGLYWPHVGMYNWKEFGEVDRFDVRATEDAPPGDHLELAPVKVVAPVARPTGTAVGARVGDLAELTHYAVAGPVQPGATLTLTLYYAVTQPSAQPLTRFVQVRDAENRIVAQHDGEPQAGLNPTWAWLPGETVQDRVTIQLPQDLPQGRYTLYVGFYDPAANFQRLPVVDAQGRTLPNAEAPLDLEEARWN